MEINIEGNAFASLFSLCHFLDCRRMVNDGAVTGTRPKNKRMNEYVRYTLKHFSNKYTKVSTTTNNERNNGIGKKNERSNERTSERAKNKIRKHSSLRGEFEIAAIYQIT